jgi:L-fuculose-phosphate aldolase
MEKQEIIKTYSKKLSELTPGTTGNLSTFSGEKVAITPTGVCYGCFGSEDVPILSMDGDQLSGELQPSSEAPMHICIYEKFDTNAIVHTHSPWSTTLSIIHEPLPPVHYVVASSGAANEVPVADYATFGTEELAQNVVDEMKRAGTTACLMANHGLVATGDDLDDAIEAIRAIEFTARIYCQAKYIGEPNRLSKSEMEDVLKKWQEYG